MKKIVYSLCAIFISLPGFAVAQMGQYSFHDLIYTSEPYKLYEQSDLTRREDYQAATRKQQQNMLEKHFYAKKRWAYSKIIVYNLGIPVAISTVVTALALGNHYRKRTVVLEDKKPIPTINEQQMNIIRTIFTSAIVTAALYRPLTMFSESTYKYVSDGLGALNKLVFPWNDALETLEIDYVRNKPFIPSELYHAIETNFIEARSHQPFVRRGGLEANIYYAKWALGLPRKLKKVTYDAEIIDHKLEGYPEQTIQQIKNFCIRHMVASTSEAVRKIPYYFYGPPGVGKTRAAYLIAEMLDIPIAVISLADKASTALQGRVNEPGLLIKALSSRQARSARNLILLIDDADRALNAQIDPFILSLFDPATKTFYSPYLGTDIDISHLGIIVIGNADIKDEGLKNRLDVVKFQGYSTEYKRKIVWESLFPEMLAPHKTSSLPLSESDFTERDRDKINNIIDFDKDPGFRSLKLELTNFIEGKVIQKNVIEKFEEKPDEKPYAETIVPDSDDDDNVDEMIEESIEQEEPTPPALIDDSSVETDASNLSLRSSYNVAGISFTPEEIAAEVKKHLPDFEITYKSDFRQAIADSWPKSIDDSVARKDWGLTDNYDLAGMTKVMLDEIKKKLG